MIVFNCFLFKKKKEKKPILVISRITGVSIAVKVQPYLRIALLATNKEESVATNPMIETMLFMYKV